MDGGVHGGGGAAAGVLLDQGVRPPLQRQVPRRQELPLSRGHDERGVPARAGDARSQEEGRALLRPLRARVGDPRHRRPAAARLPRAHLLRRGVQERSPHRPPLPARLHRQVLGALRGADLRRGPPGTGRGVLRLHDRPHGHLHPPSGGADGGGGRGHGVRAGRPAARRHRGPEEGHGEERGRARRRDRRRPRRGRGGRAGGRRPDLPRARRPGPRPARLGHRQGGGHHHGRARRARPAAALRRGDGRLGAQGGPRPRAARARGTRPGMAHHPPGRPRLPARPAARRQEVADGDGAAQCPAGSRAAQDQARLRPHHPLTRPGGDRRGPRPGQRPAAHRVLRHLPPPGRGRRGLHGRLRGRAAAQERVPALPDPRLRGPGRRPVDARGARPPLPALPRRQGEDGGVVRRRGRAHRGGRPAQAIRVPAAARRGRRRSAPGRGRPAGAGRTRHRRHRRVRTGQAAGGGLAARRGRPGGAAPHQRGPLPPPAHPGRGPPLRDHLPADQAGQAPALRPAGRRPRSRRDAQAGTDQALRLGQAAARRHPGPDTGGSGHRPQDRRDHRRRPRPLGPGRARREHRDGRDH